MHSSFHSTSQASSYSPYPSLLQTPLVSLVPPPKYVPAPHPYTLGNDKSDTNLVSHLSLSAFHEDSLKDKEVSVSILQIHSGNSLKAPHTPNERK